MFKHAPLNVLSEKELKRIDEIPVKLRIYGGLFIIDVEYWLKTSPRFAKSMLACLRFLNDDEFISEEDKVMFEKGYVLIKEKIEIKWYNLEWTKKMSVIKERKSAAFLAILRQLKDMKAAKLYGWPMTQRVAKEMERMENE